MSHVTDGPQQQALYGRPVLADVLQPKLEIHQAANGKMVDSDEGLKGKPQAEKVGDTELQEMEPPARKVVEADGARLEETPEKSLDSQNVSKQRPVEVPQVPEARARKAPMPDEQSDLQKTIDVKSKSENVSRLFYIGDSPGIASGICFSRVLYCIVSIHLYSASCSAHQSEAVPVREAYREERILRFQHCSDSIRLGEY